MIEIEVEELSLRESLELLNSISNGATRAISGAINKTAGNLLTDAGKYITAQLNITAKKAREENKKTANAKPNKLEKKMIWKRGKMPATSQYIEPKLNFGGKKLTKGYAFTFKKSKGRKKMPEAFYAKMGSGHTNIWKRTGKKTKTGRPEIKGIFSTTPTDILSNEDALKFLQVNANERMRVNLLNQINRFLK